MIRDTRFESHQPNDDEGGPYRELIPAPQQKLRVKLPAGSKPKGVRLLVNGQTPRT